MMSESSVFPCSDKKRYALLCIMLCSGESICEYKANWRKNLGVAPTKIIFVITLSFKVAFVSSLIS